MIILSILIAAKLSMPGEKGVMGVFQKVSQVESKEDAITRNDFHENEFLPAVNRMIELLPKDQCNTCLIEYLKALDIKIASVDETLTDQLGTIIYKHAKELNSACISVSKKSLNRLEDKFEWAIKNAAYFNKISENDLAAKIPKCYRSVNSKLKK